MPCHGERSEASCRVSEGLSVKTLQFASLAMTRSFYIILNKSIIRAFTQILFKRLLKYYLSIYSSIIQAFTQILFKRLLKYYLLFEK